MLARTGSTRQEPDILPDPARKYLRFCELFNGLKKNNKKKKAHPKREHSAQESSQAHRVDS